MSLAPAAIFGRAIAEIQDSVCMPILLPAKLPAVLQDPEIKLARGLVTPDGYSIALLYDDTTGDAGVAAWFIGSAQFRPSDFADDRQLRLANGAVGFFSPASCGVLMLGAEFVVGGERRDVQHPDARAGRYAGGRTRRSAPGGRECQRARRTRDRREGISIAVDQRISHTAMFESVVDG